MSKYVLNKNNALFINGKVYALVRESKVTNNSVCAQCALYDTCVDYEDNHHLSALCLPEISDGRWFFVDAEQLTTNQRSELNSYIIDNIHLV